MPGLLRGITRNPVVAGTAKSVSKRVSGRQSGRWAHQDQSSQDAAPAAAAPAPPAPAAPASSTTDPLAQLKELGELKSQGILTDAEFEDQKRRILGAAS